MKKTTYITDSERTEIGTTDIDAFYSEKAPSYLSSGHHIVRITHFEVVPEKTVTSRTDVYTTKPYILLDLADQKDKSSVTTTRLYQNFVPYFMDQIGAQTEGATSAMPLSAVLKHLMTHDFDIWVTYSREFGVQVNYREPRSR